MQVQFMIVGAQKSGTTSLARQLENHPEVQFCSVKEPGFFSSAAAREGRADLAAYHALFEPQEAVAGAGRLAGEASTMYSFLPENAGTAAAIHRYNPDMKIIYIMRQPVERAISQYAHRVSRSTTNLEAHEAVFRDPSYINRSRYGVQLRPYLQLFPRAQIHLMVFEEYVAEQAAALLRLAGFLGISPEPFTTTPQQIRANVSAGSVRLGARTRSLRDGALGRGVRVLMPAALRAGLRSMLGHAVERKPELPEEHKLLLWEFLRDDVEAVERLLGRRLQVWRQGYPD